MAFENTAEQQRPREVEYGSSAALLPSKDDYQSFFKRNVTPGREPSFIDFGHSDIYSSNKNLLASDSQQPMPWEIEPSLNRAVCELLVKPVTEKMTQERVQTEIQKIPEIAWSKAYSEFPQLKAAGLSEKQSVSLMKAIIANEVEHYDLADGAEDGLARLNMLPSNRTFGISQLTINALHKREREFPEQLHGIQNHEREALLAESQAPLLVAATLTHYIRQFEQYNYPITQESLGYAYNPDLYAVPGHKDIMPTKEKLQTSEHAANIRRWLAFFSE